MVAFTYSVWGCEGMCKIVTFFLTTLWLVEEGRSVSEPLSFYVLTNCPLISTCFPKIPPRCLLILYFMFRLLSLVVHGQRLSSF